MLFGMTQRNSEVAPELWAVWDQVGIEATTQVRRTVSQMRETHQAKWVVNLLVAAAKSHHQLPHSHVPFICFTQIGWWEDERAVVVKVTQPAPGPSTPCPSDYTAMTNSYKEACGGTKMRAPAQDMRPCAAARINPYLSRNSQACVDRTPFFPPALFASGATSNIGFGEACGAGQPITYPNLTVEQAKQTCCDIRANGSECTGFSFVVPVI